MLPSRERGRGRARNRGQECVPGTPQLMQEPTEEKDSESFPHSSGRGRGVRKHPQVRPSKSSDETSVASQTSSHQKKETRVVQPEELGFKRKLAITPSLPPRPSEGTLGKRIKLVSNCFHIKVPSGNIYHYDVNIIRKQKNMKSEESNVALVPAGTDHRDKKYRCLNTRTNRRIIALMLSSNQLFHNVYAAYDGKKNLYARNPILAQFPIKCEVVLPDENADPENQLLRQDTFIVEIKPVIKKDGNCFISLDSLNAFFGKRTSCVPHETVMALETILRHGPCLQFTPVGRSFFSPPSVDNMHPLGGGLEIWFGYHQSVRLGQWGPMVNLDMTATTFHQKGPVLSYIADFMNTTVTDLRRRAFLPNTEIKRISKILKNMRIEVTHLKNYRRKYRILKLVKENANRLEFDMTVNGRNVRRTVADYFRERYEKVLQYPNLPCLQVYPENKKTYLPIEVCEIVEGQHARNKLESKQTAEMIKFTATSPSERFSKIRETARNSDFNNDRYVRQFELEVSHEPIHLEGRVLDPPSIQYHSDKTINPNDGSWNMRSVKFLDGATIESWVLLSFAELDTTILNNFSNLLVKIARDTGMSVTPPKFSDIIDVTRWDLKQLFEKMKTKYKADLAVMVIPANDKSIYGRIKQVAETVVGLTTQCIKETNVTNPKKCSPQLVCNLCQKINAKMGGKNNSLVLRETLDIMKKPVIVIGADVNHPGPSPGIKPSLAACVGSLGVTLSKYAVSVRAQANVDEKKQAVEIISDLENMIKELLKAFYNYTNKKKPEKIIFYRDGVSEGQFEKVREHEVRCIRTACKALQQDYEPGITFIVVQKRHHTRFMPENIRDGIGNMKNIPPGTTVDTAVTEPVNFDFFLCSHFGLKGTSRPSHYTVLEDDNNFSADDLQKFTYQLCHTYARCTKSISIPVPVAYAHLAAYRARLHLEAGLEESTSGSESSVNSEDFQPLSQSVIESIKTITGFENTMYYV